MIRRRLEIDKYKNLYCAMYIDISCEREDLVDMIIGVIGGNKGRFGEITTDICDINVNYNDEFNSKDKDGSFIFYRYFLDVDPMPEASEAEYISCISQIVEHFVSKGISIVPACDFEDELPYPFRMLGK